MTSKPVTESDVLGLTRGIDALADSIDSLQSSVQANAIDHATIKTKLEDVLSQLKSLAKTVSGDNGLVSRVSVLESTVESVEADLEKKEKEIREALRREVDDLRRGLEDIRTAHHNQTKEALAEAKADVNNGFSRRLSLWSALVATAALVLTALLFGIENCQAKKPSASAPSPEV